MTATPSLYHPRFILILVLQFLFGLGFSSFFLLPKYLTEVHHADATLIGRVMAAGPVFAVISMLSSRRSPPFGWKLDGGGKQRFCPIGCGGHSYSSAGTCDPSEKRCL